ncbi:glycosyltransferase family 2 protein [Mesorhizobium sp. ZMM04-5]|uniref:Glycosyltransferase family 2 protein n=1 Tax=Mesorhizobium marinum TaxID=3228790 RepID=A0ABV3R6I4_9HYPH
MFKATLQNGSKSAAAPQSPTEFSIVVAVLTYKRNDLLQNLLASYAEMEIPSGIRSVLIVVDNDSAASAQPIVEAQRSSLGEVQYVVESRRGIPVARNRALDEALALGADAVCFIDDDEYPARNWLKELISCWKSTGAHLIGGPVNVASPPDNANAWHRAINASLAARMRRKNRTTAHRASTGGRYTVVTNNWLCDVRWLRRTGIRFDETMQISGGSDTAFFRSARAAGATPAWCPNAVVWEKLSLDRLSLSYQFIRGAAQSNTHFILKNPKLFVPSLPLNILYFALRFLLGLVLLVIPVYGLASPVMAVRSMGWSVGRIQALLGFRSSLYK